MDNLGQTTPHAQMNPAPSEALVLLRKALEKLLPLSVAAELMQAESAAHAVPGYDAPICLVRLSHADRHGYALVGTDCVRFVVGTAEDFTEFALRHPPRLTDDNAAGYLRLAFVLMGAPMVESPADIVWKEKAPVGFDLTTIAEPLNIEESDQNGRRRFETIYQGSGGLVRFFGVLWPDGLIQPCRSESAFPHPSLATPVPPPKFADLLEGLAVETSPAMGENLACTVDLSPAQDEEETDEMDASDIETPAFMREPAPELSGFNETFAHLAEVLLIQALRDADDLGLGPKAGRYEGLSTYLRRYRPTIAIETVYLDLRQDFAELLARVTELPVHNGLVSASNGTSQPRQPSVVVMTQASFVTQSETLDMDAAMLLNPICRGPHVGVFVVERVGNLPLPARDMIDLTLRVPRLDAASFAALTRKLFEVPARTAKRDWLRYALPRDIARAKANGTDRAGFLRELEQTVTRRLRQYSAPDDEAGPRLADLHGLGEARVRMEELAAEIRAAQSGDIDWAMVDRGYLFVGPPGTGKTTLVKALAKECGVRFVLASASAWQEGSSLGPHIQNIRRSFREARLYAPSILFIDEIDSLGARGQIEERNSQYQTVVINTVLEELQGFEGREGVVVVAATNNAQNVDPALRRPGRLDRVIQVPYPNVAALAEIFGYYLHRAEKHGFTSAGLDLDRLARLSFGRTGAHVELYVRGAQRRSRREGRSAITETDLIDEIVNMPPGELRTALPPDAMRRVAVHEAGHALMNITGPRGGQGLTYVSITPRADGSLGFVAQIPSGGLVTTEAEMQDEICIILGGRAAEELVFGRAAVSGGAGGEAGSDLEVASRMVIRMLTRFGYSQTGGLLWLAWDSAGESSKLTAEAIRNLPLGNELLTEARTTLDQLYESTKARLSGVQKKLNEVAELLIKRQDVTGEVVREIYER